MSSKATSIFKESNVSEALFIIHDKYVVVPVDKTLNNFILFAKHCIYCLIDKLGLDRTHDSQTYTATAFKKI